MSKSKKKIETPETPETTRKRAKIIPSKELVFANVPKGKGLLYTMDGRVVLQAGPFTDLPRLYKMIGCQYVQMVSCTMGALKDVAVLIMDEEGAYNSEMNEIAMKNVGDQVFGGKLHGNILLLHSEDFE